LQGLSCEEPKEPFFQDNPLKRVEDIRLATDASAWIDAVVVEGSWTVSVFAWPGKKSRDVGGGHPVRDDSRISIDRKEKLRELVAP